MPRPTSIFLAEDSEDDAFFFRWALQKSGVQAQLTHAADGASALRQLQAVVAGQQARPDIVFLDLKLPQFTGFEILEWLRDYPCPPSVAPLHVIVLSGSEHASDSVRALSLGAAGYIVKPIAAAELRTRVESLGKNEASASTS